ncbi:MAG TPA: PHP domain-containing protein [Desulfotomaculum sp.]|nr:PHP domain-containing protein [Desulfotomaculum sp.]
MNLNQILEQGYYDLHIHTTASDGAYSPKEIVQKAFKLGLKTTAITDHDSIQGVNEAQQTGHELGIRVIAGVELSTKYKGKSIDVLGYNFSLDNKELNNRLASLSEGREGRALRIINKFVDLGMPISLADVKKFSGDGNIGRPHIAKAIVAKGYIKDLQTVFDKFLSDGKPAAIDKIIISPQEGINLIHKAGGIAVIAHPGLIDDDMLVHELMQFDFDGIEVWHRKHTKEDCERYLQIAEEYGLIMTGGSDFHNDEHELGQFFYK